MMYRIVDVERKTVDYTFDVKIEEIATGKVVVADGMRVWDEDQYSLGYMFRLVEKGLFSEGMLSDEDEMQLIKDLGIENIDEYFENVYAEQWEDCHRNGLYK